MGYRVEYGQAQRTAAPVFKKSRVGILTVVFLLLFVLAVKLYWPEGAAILDDLSLLGNQTATRKAFSTLVEDLQSGQAFSAAVTAFCQEIIADAGITLQ